MTVENSKGECNLGQHEINFRYDEALAAADNHAIYKNGAKEIAAQEGMSITFMAKFNEREGNSCHIHCSLADDGRRQRLRRRPAALRPLHRRPARLHARADAALRAARQLLQALRRRAPSRRPRSPGATTTAPARCASSATARRCASRTGSRAPTSTPTWRCAAMIAAGLHGIDSELDARAAAARATPTTSDKPRVPHNIYEARDRFAESEIAREAFGAGGRRPLPEPRQGRARRLRGSGHRLGALPGLRATLRRPGRSSGSAR